MYKEFENGIDLDFDGHCDICGKFVDSFGHHKASLIMDEEYQYVYEYLPFDKMIRDYDDDLDPYRFTQNFFMENPYQNPDDFIGRRYWDDVKRYTNPDIGSAYSGTSLNYYLRNGRLYHPYAESVAGMEEMNKNICNAINDFKVKNTFATYRGFSIKHDSDYCKMLDEAYLKLKYKEEATRIVDKGFTSSSYSLGYAKSLSEINKGDDTSVLIAIIAEEGTKCMPLYEKLTTLHPNENEVLFPSNQAYLIVGMNRKKLNNKYFYKIKMIAIGEK